MCDLGTKISGMGIKVLSFGTKKCIKHRDRIVDNCALEALVQEIKSTDSSLSLIEKFTDVRTRNLAQFVSPHSAASNRKFAARRNISSCRQLLPRADLSEIRSFLKCFHVNC